MNKTLTLAQVLENKTQSQVFSDILDQATQDELIDYFYYRNICEDDTNKFIHFFQRNMRVWKWEYVNSLRVQNTEFDPMVTRYLERQVLNTVSNTEQGVIAGSDVLSKNTVNGGNVTVNNTSTENGTGASTTDGQSAYSNQNSGSDNTTNNGQHNETDRARNINSVFPQANVSSATSGTLDDPISYRYATNMTDTQNRKNGTDSNVESATHSGNESGSGTNRTTEQATSERTVQGSQTTSNNATENITSNNTTSKTTTNSGSEDSNLRERLTGRENYDAGTLLSHARDYIASTNAFMQLVKRLEVCFIGNLRYGD